MRQMIISTYSYQLQIQEYIDKRLEKLRPKEYIPNIKVEKKTNGTFITCFFPVEMSQPKQQRYFKEYIITPLAGAMADLIQNEFAIEYGNGIIQATYHCGEIVITGIKEDHTQNKRLLELMIDEMMEQDNFCLDGWIRFRLSKYKTYIMDMVDNLIVEYEAYKEYEEFIMLLQEFIFRQESLMDEVHVIPDYKGEIDLYNEENEKITALCEEEYDDLVLGTILTLAPLRIVVHKKDKCKNIRLIDTIKRIYKDRVTHCQGCESCNKSRFKIGIIRAIKDILTQKKV